MFGSIEDRINEFWNRAVKGELNPAYEVAFKVGLMCDIEEKLIDRDDPDLPIYLYQSSERSEKESKELFKKRKKLLKSIGIKD